MTWAYPGMSLEHVMRHAPNLSTSMSELLRKEIVSSSLSTLLERLSLRFHSPCLITLSSTFLSAAVVLPLRSPLGQW
eukprot:766949-Prymnesium_polylepis.1